MYSLYFILRQNFIQQEFRFYSSQILANAVSFTSSEWNVQERFDFVAWYPSFGIEIVRILEIFLFVVYDWRNHSNCWSFWHLQCSKLQILWRSTNEQTSNRSIKSQRLVKYSISPFHSFKFLWIWQFIIFLKFIDFLLDFFVNFWILAQIM